MVSWFRSASSNILNHLNKNMGPYEILGIPHNSTEDDVKKVYRKLALKYHPDKNRGPNSIPDSAEKFREVTEAYKQIINGSDDDIFNEFPEIFEMAKMFGKMMGLDVNSVDDVITGFINLSAPNTPMDPFASILHNVLRPKGSNVNFDLQLTLEQLYKGGNFDITYNIKVKTGKMKEISSSVGGFGGFANFGTNTIEKKVILVPEERLEQRVTSITIPEGYDSTYPIVVKGVIPCSSSRGRNGDLVVNISTTNHETFKRVGYDLKTKLTITLKESLIGFDRKIRLLDGEELELNCKNIINPYDRKEISGAGMPIDKDRSGNLYIKFHIEFPTELTDKKKKELENLLI